MNEQLKSSCLCCQIATAQQHPPGGIIYRDAHVVLNQHLQVAIPGYLVAFPIQHSEHWNTLDETSALQLMRVVKRAAAILESQAEVERVYVCTFAEQTRHLHVHIFPRYTWLLQLEDIYTEGKLDGSKLLTRAWQRYQVRNKLVTDAQVMDTVTLLKEKLNT